MFTVPKGMTTDPKPSALPVTDPDLFTGKPELEKLAARLSLQVVPKLQGTCSHCSGSW